MSASDPDPNPAPQPPAAPGPNPGGMHFYGPVTLGAAIAGGVGNLQQGNVGGAPAQAASTFGPFCVPYRRNPQFVGRAALLADLVARLAAPGGPVPALVGTGGLGKTQIAVEYAHRHQAGYPGGVFWLNMAQPEGVATQVAALAGPEGLNLPGWDPQAFDRNLAAVKAAWREPLARLLIFDNLEDPALLDWAPKTGGTRVLITSRRMQWAGRSNVHPLALGPLDRPAALELLLTGRAAHDPAVPALLAQAAAAEGAPVGEGSALRGSGGASAPVGEGSALRGSGGAGAPVGEGSALRGSGGNLPTGGAGAALQQAAADICDEVGDLPLALALAGAYLEAYPRISLTRYRDDLRTVAVDHPSLAAELDEPLPTGHEPSIAATFALSYNRLDPAKPADALARTLFHRAAHLAPAPIPRRLLLRAAGLDPDAAATEIAAGPALARLAALGLLEELPDGDLRLHRLLAAFARSHTGDPAGDQSKVEESVIREFRVDEEAGNPLAALAYSDHLRHLLERAKSHSSLEDANLASFYYSIGLLLYYVGKYDEAGPYYEQALKIRELVLGPTHPDTLQSRNNMGYLLMTLGNYEAARPLLEGSLAIREQTLGPNHHLTAQSLNNVALLMYDQGHYIAARPLFERALAIREKELGLAHPWTAQTVDNLARLLKALNDLDAARSLHERALEIREQKLGPTHPWTAESHYKLARVLHNLGDHSAAHTHYQRALRIYQDAQSFGPDHPDTRRVRIALEYLLRQMADAGAAGAEPTTNADHE